MCRWVNSYPVNFSLPDGTGPLNTPCASPRGPNQIRIHGVTQFAGLNSIQAGSRSIVIKIDDSVRVSQPKGVSAGRPLPGPAKGTQSKLKTDKSKR